MNAEQLEELVLQSLEHELVGVDVYRAALSCVVNDDLRAEWRHFLEQTRTHVTALEEVCAALGIDAYEERPGRAVIRALGRSLLAGMTRAREAGDPVAAELTACECVLIAETKDRLDWELLRRCAFALEPGQADVLERACDAIEEQEDEHVYHARGWCRELWRRSLGLKAVLPPPEERRRTRTALAAARAEQAAVEPR